MSGGLESVHIRIHDVQKWYGDLHVLRRCSLDVEKGELVTLLGPSGCGKTTLLRAIAGFVIPEEGAILIGGCDVTLVPPNRRQVGMVFQHYALFPHMTVFDNVAYGLRIRRTPRAEIRRRVQAALDLVELSGLERRWPRQLSGGQQQRVALARVLVLEPQVLLLDEPFGALDAKLRQAMQVDLRKLIRRLGITTLFVTHDQDEALTISDRIAVMHAGEIEQVGRPLEIYDRPATAYVAGFIGVSNLIPARADGGVVRLAPGVEVPTSEHGAVTVVVRPENLAIAAASDGQVGWCGTVSFVKHGGLTTEYEIETADGRPLKATAMRGGRAGQFAVGDRVRVEIREPGACVVLAGEAA